MTAVLTGASRPADDLTARLDATRRALRRSSPPPRSAAKPRPIRPVRTHCVSSVIWSSAPSARSTPTRITLREGERLMRDISAAYDLAHKAPAAREIDDAVGELRRLQEQLAPRVREVREMDEWRRFANAQRQEQLIAMAEAIVAVPQGRRRGGHARRIWRPPRAPFASCTRSGRRSLRRRVRPRSGCGIVSVPRPTSFARAARSTSPSSARSAPRRSRRRPRIVTEAEALATLERLDARGDEIPAAAGGLAGTRPRVA